MKVPRAGKPKLILPNKGGISRADIGRPIQGDVPIPMSVSRKVQKDVPLTWARDDLSSYWDMAASNMVTNFVHGTSELKLVQRVDHAFWNIATNLINSKGLVVALLLLRCHAAYRAASMLAVAGAASDTYPLIRSVLEIAGYGLLIHWNPKLGSVWLERHTSAKDKNRNKDAFQIAKVKAVIEKADKGLLKLFNELYETSIDFGGHPNERSVTTNMFLSEDATQKKFNLQYLHGHSIAVRLALKNTARAGLFGLHAFQHAMPERFQLLGLRDEVIALRKFM